MMNRPPTRARQAPMLSQSPDFFLFLFSLLTRFSFRRKGSLHADEIVALWEGKTLVSTSHRALSFNDGIYYKKPVLSTILRFKIAIIG